MQLKNAWFRLSSLCVFKIEEWTVVRVNWVNLLSTVDTPEASSLITLENIQPCPDGGLKQVRKPK